MEQLILFVSQTIVHLARRDKTRGEKLKCVKVSSMTVDLAADFRKIMPVAGRTGF